MSYAAERWARAQKAGNSRAKAVLIEIAHCLNGQTGKCTPSVSYLAEVTEMRPHTVCSATAHLVEIGLITKTTVKTPTGKACIYSLVGFNPEDWEHDRVLSKPTSPHIAETVNMGIAENDNTHIVETDNTPSRGVAETDNTRIAETDKTGIAETDNRTGNKNREIEQGNNTDVHSAVFHADVSDLDLFDELPPVNDSDIIPTQVEIVTEQKRTRKPSDQRKRSSPREGTRIDPNLELPDEWREICERLDPDLDPNLVFDNFKNYWLGVSGRGALKADWKATWRNCVSSYRNAPDWKRNPMLKKNFVRKDPNVVQAKVVTHELTQEQRKKIGYGICYD